MRGINKWLARLIHWTARLIGTIAAAFWLCAVLLATLLGTDRTPTWSAEGVAMLALTIASVLAVLIAWRRETSGGAFVIICGLANCIFGYLSASINRLFPVLIFGVPFLVAGVLFLIGGLKSRKG